MSSDQSPGGSGSVDLDAVMRRALRPDLAGLHAYAVQSSAGMVKLDTMENPYRLSTDLQRGLGERLGRVAVNRYPAERMNDLRDALAKQAGMPEDCALTIGNGSDEIINMLTLACARAGQGGGGGEVPVMLSPVPSFVLYGMTAALYGMRFVGVPLRAHDFELDVDAMLAAIAQDRPSLVFLAYPNNPTATLWNSTAIERVIEAVAAVQGLVVMDEAYQPFASRDSMAWLRRWPHVMVMRTMSKFGLAGVRIGYLIGRQAMLREIEKLRPPFNVSVLNAEAALFALDHVDVFAKQAADIRSERARVHAELTKLPGVTPYPSEANMILTRVPDAARAFSGMLARKVLVKNVSPMHPMLAQCLRLTIGTPDENTLMLEALRASI